MFDGLMAYDVHCSYIRETALLAGLAELPQSPVVLQASRDVLVRIAALLEAVPVLPIAA